MFIAPSHGMYHKLSLIVCFMLSLFVFEPIKGSLVSLSVALHVAITLNFKLKEEISNHFVSHVGKLDGK